MKGCILINNRKIGDGEKTFIIAEMSGNHLKDFNRAVEIVKAAKWAGADAIKLQTYTPDTITLDCNNEYFQIKQGTIWDGRTLYDLYREAYTPWEWQPKLKDIAKGIGLAFISSPFDFTAVDFLGKIEVDAYKIASFEITDIPLIRYVASKQKTIIISTGIARLADIEEAVKVCREVGNEKIILLKCVSEYPTDIKDINLKTIINMKNTFNTIVGLSDHSLENAVDIAAVAMGADVIEKHLILNRKDGGPDSKFSMEPEEFKRMVEDIRVVEEAMGKVTYELSEKQISEREHCRSLFVAKDILKGEKFNNDNIRSIRPGFGIRTKYIDVILGKKAKCDIVRGTPLTWELIE